VFHDPFLPLGFEWRDTFAELTAVFATEHAKIVIVTGLSHRPESWIENPQIVRVRVDKVRRRTVGFSSEDDEMDSLVHELRENLAQEDIEDSEDLQEEQEAEFYVPPVPLPFGKPESIETETTRMPAIDSFHPHSPTSTGSWQRNEWLTELTEGLGHVSSEMKRLSARSAPSRAGLWVAVGMLLMLATLVFVLAPGQAPDTEVARLTVPGPETAAAKHYDTGKRVLDEYPVRIRESVLLAYVGSSDEVDSIQELLSTEVLEPGAQSSGKDARPNSIDNVPAAKSADDLDGSLKVEASDID
jgi:hypothetical protein